MGNRKRKPNIHIQNKSRVCKIIIKIQRVLSRQDLRITAKNFSKYLKELHTNIRGVKCVLSRLLCFFIVFYSSYNLN